MKLQERPQVKLESSISERMEWNGGMEEGLRKEKKKTKKKKEK